MTLNFDDQTLHLDLLMSFNFLKGSITLQLFRRFCNWMRMGSSSNYILTKILPMTFGQDPQPK